MGTCCNCNCGSSSYDIYSDYLVKYINEYKNQGFNISYLTIQNEPFATQTWESCVFSLDEQKDFIYNHLIDKLDDNVFMIILNAVYFKGEWIYQFSKY